MARDDAKLAPDWPNVAQDGPNMASRKPDEGPKKAPRKPQDSPQRRQVGPKSHPREPNKAPSGPEAGGSQMAWRRLASQGPKFRDAPSETHVVQGGVGGRGRKPGSGGGNTREGEQANRTISQPCRPYGGWRICVYAYVCVCVSIEASLCILRRRPLL